jgi:aromatic ring-cleaving dioxygenase
MTRGLSRIAVGLLRSQTIDAIKWELMDVGLTKLVSRLAPHALAMFSIRGHDNAFAVWEPFLVFYTGDISMKKDRDTRQTTRDIID